MVYVFAGLFELLLTWNMTSQRTGLTTPFPVVCAEADLIVLSLIEWRGQEGTEEGAVLAAAYLELTKARRFCDQGGVEDALATYRDLKVALDLAD